MRLSKARKAFVTAMMRDTIFEAAGSVLEHHGTRGLTMDRVASVAGVTTGSLYTYFENKNELLDFVYNRIVEPFLRTIEDIVDESQAATQKLGAILRMALEYTVKHRGLIRLLADADCSDGVRRNTRPRLLRIVTTVFEQGIAAGEFRPHDPSHSARMYLGCLSELFELQAGGASDDEVKQFAATLMDATVNGFSIHAKKASGCVE
jgi:AcrR family transcriptional regulator